MTLRPSRESDVPAIVAMRSRFAPEAFSVTILGVRRELTGAQRVYERAGMRIAARFEVYER